jgi:hypothetical protein
MGTLEVGECGVVGWDGMGCSVRDALEIVWYGWFHKEGHGEQGLRVGEGWAHMYRTQD